MALKDNWQDLQDSVEGVAGSGDEISVAPINKIAHAVIDLEENEDVVTNTAPYIGDNGNWYVYDVQTKTYIDSGMPSRGEQGLQGEKGEKGDKGENGKTPVKGVDYFTPADIEEFNNMPKQFVEFANNPLGEMKFVSDSDGLKLVWDWVEGKAEHIIASWESDVVLSTHAELAYRADADELGRNIRLTYATKEEVETKIQAYIDEAILGGAW